MALNKLKVVATEFRPRQPASSAQASKLQSQATWDRRWLRDAASLDPFRNAIERERLTRTQNLLLEHIDLSGKKVVDLGCGTGRLSQWLLEQGAEVHACDISENALKLLPPQARLTKSQEFLPLARLPDDSFDLVLCTDVIAELEPRDRRYLVAEVYRLMKPSGYGLVSSPTHVGSKDALPKLKALLQTELEEVAYTVSHHAWYLRFRYLLKRSRFHKQINQSQLALDLLEKLSLWLAPESSSSHLIFLGRRRKVFG